LWIGSVTFRISCHARQRGPPVHYFGLRASRSGIGLSEERSILSMPRMLPDKRALARGGPTGRFGTGRTKVAACLSPLLLQDERPGAVSGPAATGA
jgi:hypothetical protein